MKQKIGIIGVVTSVVMALDLITKRWALEALAAGPKELLDGLIPLTLAYNKGAAFGLHVGEDSRWFFVPVTILALFLLVGLYRQAQESDTLRHLSLALVIAGALGNLYDRVRWSLGVIDFIGPINLGFWDFPIFNVADIAISCGAVLLAYSFWLEGRHEAAEAQATVREAG